jgi:hypothetical protein
MVGAEFEVNIDKDWASTVRKLKGADKVVRKHMNKEIRELTKPIIADMKSEIMGWESAAVGGGGRAGRARTHAERSKNFKSGQKTAQNRLGKGGFGLRSTIASSIQTKITLSGSRSGVRIRVDPAKLGGAARKLPANIDKGSWRHPVYGNRSTWVQQTGSKGWFSDTGIKHYPKIRHGIAKAMQSAIRELD